MPAANHALAQSASLVIPTIIESSTRGERAYDLFSRLLRERIVLVNGPIEDQLSSLVVAELLFLASESSNRPHQYVHQLSRWSDYCWSRDL